MHAGNTQHTASSGGRCGIGTFRALGSWNGDSDRISGHRNTRISLAVADVFGHDAIATSNSDGKFTVTATRGVPRHKGENARCRCNGNAQLAERWRKKAASDTGAFVQEMFGLPPEKLDVTDRRALRRDCAPFLPKDKLEMLVTQTGRPSKTFWAEFSGKLKPVKGSGRGKLLTDAEVLAYLKERYPYAVKGVKKLADVKLTALHRFRLRNDLAFTSRLSDEALEDLGVVVTHQRKRKMSSAQTLAEAEAFVLTNFKDAKRMEHTGRLEIGGRNSKRIWKYIRDKYAATLPKSFLDEYDPEMYGTSRIGRPSGSKNSRERVLVNPKEPKAQKTDSSRNAGVVKPPKTKAEQQKSKLKRRDKKLRDAGIDPQVKKQQDREKAEQSRVKREQRERYGFDGFDGLDAPERPSPAVPSKMITDPERLRMRLCLMANKQDHHEGLSTPFEKFNNLHWALLDTIKDSVDPRLLERFRPQLEAVRSRLNRATGGAYSSLLGNQHLAVAHITTAWLCGDL
jgi:uncharacterized damage-inducible protein DinB